MKFPISEENNSAREIDAAFDAVREKYLSSLNPAIKMTMNNVMIGNGSIAQVDTFEPEKVVNFYECFTNFLDGWKTTGISRFKTADLHRLYCQFSKEIRGYTLLGYFGIQYHALPYFKVDMQVIDLQKQLNLITNDAGMAFTTIAAKGDQIIRGELEKIGYRNMNIEELLVKLMEDKELVDSLDKKASAVENEFPRFQEMFKRRDKLLSELSNLMIEVYQILPESIDHNKMAQGEEGVVTDISIEKIKSQKTKETDSFFNVNRISREDTKLIVAALFEFENAFIQIESSRRKLNC